LPDANQDRLPSDRRRKMQMAIMIALGINLTLGIVMCLS
jgi:hypothetical protein